MRINQLNVAAGTKIMIGRPANPMIGAEATARLTAAVAEAPGVSEAHLPQVYVPGVTAAPAQVLVLALEPQATVDSIMAMLGPRLHDIIPESIHFDVWPLAPGHPLLRAVRQADCQIYGARLREAAAPQPWWKFWA